MSDAAKHSLKLCRERQIKLKSGLKSEVDMEKKLDEKVRETMEQEFFKKWKVKASFVRKQYKDLVRKCSKSCSIGHYVRLYETPDERRLYYGIDLVPRGASHIFLQSEHYKKCIPDDMIRESYKTIGRYIWVDPETHLERWGN